MIGSTLKLKTLTLVLATALVTAGGLMASAAVAPADLVQPISEYKIWITGEVDVLVTQTKALTDAIRAGDVAKAKSLYAGAHVHYERIEPIAELFSDIDKTVDSRADDYSKKEADPAFIGFHRIEYGLFSKNTVDGLVPVADKLDADLTDLKGRIDKLELPPAKVVDGAAALIEEVAKTKISGEEDRYSRTDLWDFSANVDGAKKLNELLHPLTEKANPKLVARIDANFAKVDAVLAKYALPDGGYKGYDALSKKDRVAVKGPVTALAEDLAKLKGTLGVK